MWFSRKNNNIYLRAAKKASRNVDQVTGICRDSGNVAAERSSLNRSA
jgi:hypothetical protein